MYDNREKFQGWLQKAAREFFEGYHSKIEADLREWIKIYPLEDLTIVRGHLPKGVTALREYSYGKNEGHIIDKCWLVLNSELKA